MSTLLILLLVLLLVSGGGGYYEYAKSGGSRGFGFFGVILILVLVAYALDRVP